MSCIYLKIIEQDFFLALKKGMSSEQIEPEFLQIQRGSDLKNESQPEFFYKSSKAY